MKNLLLATDLSSRSDRALERALALSDELQAQLLVLHIVDEDLPYSIANRLKAEAELAIDEQLDEFPSRKKQQIRRKVIFGMGYKDILTVANEIDADLIIGGTHREDTLRDAFLGTTIERVIRYGNDPVLVVRDRMKEAYRRVLVGIDFSAYSRRAVEFAVQFVPRGEIYLVHAFEVPFKGFLGAGNTSDELTQKQQAQMDAMLSDEMQAFIASLPPLPTRVQRVMREGKARTVIEHQVEQLRPDLLVIGTHGRTGVAHALLGSVAEDLLSYPPCDVLAVKAW